MRKQVRITDLSDWSALRVHGVAPRAFLDTIKRTHPDRDIDAKDVPHAVIVRAGSRVMAPPALSALHGFVGVTLPLLERLFVEFDLPRPQPTTIKEAVRRLATHYLGEGNFDLDKLLDARDRPA